MRFLCVRLISLGTPRFSDLLSRSSAFVNRFASPVLTAALALALGRGTISKLFEFCRRLLLLYNSRGAIFSFLFIFLAQCASKEAKGYVMSTSGTAQHMRVCVK